MYYFDIIETLFREKVKYLLVGGLAVNLHGVPRVTRDIDLIISTGKDNIMKLIHALAGLGYVPCFQSIPPIWPMKRRSETGRLHR